MLPILVFILSNVQISARNLSYLICDKLLNFIGVEVRM